MNIKKAILARMAELELTPYALGARIEERGAGRAKTIRNYLYKEERICRSDVLETILDELDFILCLRAEVPEGEVGSEQG